MALKFDKKIIEKNFSRGAKNYDEAALVQREAAKKLCDLAVPFIKNEARILDLGAGTGFVAKNIFDLLDKKKILKQVQDDGVSGEVQVQTLSPRHPELVSGSITKIQLFESDISFEMLKKNTKNTFKIQSDFENLPFKNNSFDLLISSFSLQWLENLEQTFSHFFSLLKPSGTLAFCIPTQESLNELKSANIFNFTKLPKAEDLILALQKNSFIEKKFQTEILEQEFESGLQALQSLKKIGANYSNKKNKTLNKTQLIQFNNFCLKNFGTTNKKVRLSWFVSYFIFVK